MLLVFVSCLAHAYRHCTIASVPVQADVSLDPAAMHLRSSVRTSPLVISRVEGFSPAMVRIHR